MVGLKWIKISQKLIFSDSLKSDYGRIEMTITRSYRLRENKLKSDYGRIEIKGVRFTVTKQSVVKIRLW